MDESAYCKDDFLRPVSHRTLLARQTPITAHDRASIGLCCREALKARQINADEQIKRSKRIRRQNHFIETTVDYLNLTDQKIAAGSSPFFLLTASGGIVFPAAPQKKQYPDTPLDPLHPR
jgi:hypothetical protein